jgi:hypothetical protein
MHHASEIDVDALDDEAVSRASTPSLEDLLIYLDAAELEGVPAEAAGLVLAAREMGRAFAATRSAGWGRP